MRRRVNWMQHQLKSDKAELELECYYLTVCHEICVIERVSECVLCVCYLVHLIIDQLVCKAWTRLLLLQSLAGVLFHCLVVLIHT